MNELYHHGVKGQKWGVRRYQNPDGTHTKEGRIRDRMRNAVFISGTSKMQDKHGQYYRDKLGKEVTNYLDNVMKEKADILVGDCVGADKMVQDYLKENGYNRVHIYVTGNEVRNNADSNNELGWKVHNIDGSMYEPGSKEWHAVKDIAMTNDAKRGMEIILDDGASATRRNINRLYQQGKTSDIYQLNADGNDEWFDVEEFIRRYN